MKIFFKKNEVLVFLIYCFILLLKSLMNFKFLILNLKFISSLFCIFLIICILYFMNYMYFYKNNIIPILLNLFSISMSLLLISINNMFFFFLVFEFSIIPIFFYLIIFGSTEKKMISSFYLFIYTSFFSYFFLFMLLLEYNFIKTNMVFFFFFFFSKLNFFKFAMLIVFFVKIPIFFFHIWLPKAHVESSTFGSMILSSILLKLGSIGIIFFFNCLFFFNLNFLFLMFLIISSSYIMILCFYLVDLKLIIAYFSISHMMFFIISIILSNFFSLNFCMLSILSHSLVSPMMFFFCMILYNNYSSRMVFKINSMFNISSSFSWMFFIYLMLNLSIPPSMNFFSEVLVFFLMIKFSLFFLIFIFLFFFISGLLNILIICKMMMMKETNMIFYFNSLKSNLIYVFIFFLFLSVLFLIKVSMMFN